MNPTRRSLLHSLLCTLLCVTIAGTSRAQATFQPETISAPAYFLMDMDTGRVLAERNAHMRMYPASTTKIMTCLVAVEHGNLNQVITVGKDASVTGESGIGLLPGEQFTLADLIRAALIHSANDACVAIAEGVAGSQPQFVDWMNQKARQLGCTDTHFVNPHGLHDPDHYTSAHDLAVIARAALREPFLINRNRLLFRWDECDGVKTGYTKEAGNCLVATATEINPVTHAPWRLLSVVMKEHDGGAWPDSQRLIQEAGFASYQPTLVARAGQVLGDEPVDGGDGTLDAAPAHDVYLPLQGDEGSHLTSTVHLFHIDAPVHLHERVGYVAYYSGDERVGQLALVAVHPVELTMMGGVHWSKRILLACLLGLACIGAASGLSFVKLNSRVRRRSYPTRSPERFAPGPPQTAAHSHSGE